MCRPGRRRRFAMRFARRGSSVRCGHRCFHVSAKSSLFEHARYVRNYRWPGARSQPALRYRYEGTMHIECACRSGACLHRALGHSAASQTAITHTRDRGRCREPLRARALCAAYSCSHEPSCSESIEYSKLSSLLVLTAARARRSESVQWLQRAATCAARPTFA